MNYGLSHFWIITTMDYHIYHTFKCDKRAKIQRIQEGDKHLIRPPYNGVADGSTLSTLIPNSFSSCCSAVSWPAFHPVMHMVNFVLMLRQFFPLTNGAIHLAKNSFVHPNM